MGMTALMLGVGAAAAAAGLVAPKTAKLCSAVVAASSLVAAKHVYVSVMGLANPDSWTSWLAWALAGGWALVATALGLAGAAGLFAYGHFMGKDKPPEGGL